MTPDAVGRPGSQAALRSANQQRVVELLRACGTLTQAQLARESGLAPATVSNIVRDLTAKGVLSISAGARGRAVGLARTSGLAAGVDFGHRHVTVAIADLAHNILSERRIEFGPAMPAAEGLSRALALLDAGLAEIDETRSSITGIGMGLPAPIDSTTGSVGAPSILPGWIGVDAATLASSVFGTEVVVDNDANLGVLAEHTWGAGAGVDNLAFLKLSEGVGAGLVLNGKLFRGRNGTAGEIGHTTIDEFGAVCRCGNRGCLETVVAARAVVNLLEPIHGVGLDIQRIVELALAGDPASSRVLADVGRQVGIALANLCNLFNPELILIGGELATAGELLLSPMREVVRRYGILSATADLTISVAGLGARAPVLGALALALSRGS